MPRNSIKSLEETLLDGVANESAIVDIFPFFSMTVCAKKKIMYGLYIFETLSAFMTNDAYDI